MHPLTEIAFSVYDEDILDLKIKIWLTEKAKDFCGFLPYEKIKEILELPEVTK